MKGNDIETVEKILPKSPFFDHFRKITVGGGHHTDIHRYGAIISNVFKLLGFKNTK